jgi:casein kinase 1
MAYSVAKYYVLTAPAGAEDAAPALLGSGAFGAVYKGIDIRSGGTVAVKLEDENAKHPQLVYEYRVLRVLKGCTGIPAVYYFGTLDGSMCQAMVMQRLGPPVARSSGRMSLPVLAHVARNVLTALQHVHNFGFVHRDLKPENLLWRRRPDADPLDRVYLIDFGLCKRVVDPKGNHIEQRDNKYLVGTPQYAAHRAHTGLELTRRDDIESLVYVLVFLFTGTLPWHSVREPKDDPYHKAMGDAKHSVSPLELCAALPPDLKHAILGMLHVAKGTHFSAVPDYAALQALWSAL